MQDTSRGAAGQENPKIFLSGLLPEEIQDIFAFPEAFRSRQIYKWASRGAASFPAMTNVPAALKETLSGFYGSMRSSSVARELADEDGSLKLQIRLRDGASVECVLLEDIEGRKTACLSSQVGCPMACAFCRTGQLGFLRNLGPDEILEQFHFLRERCGFISNVVFMGMGEPLLNLTSVRKAIRLLSDREGIGISLRKITISTSGIVPGIMNLADEGPRVRLAVSLTTADEELRSSIMPVNRTWNLDSLKSALLYYQEKTKDRITLEVVLTGNRTSSADDARKLAAWIPPLNAQVNLIPWNRIPELPFVEPKPEQVRIFTQTLENAGIIAVQRMHRGRGVMGACGQLGDTLQSPPEE